MSRHHDHHQVKSLVFKLASLLFSVCVCVCVKEREREGEIAYYKINVLIKIYKKDGKIGGVVYSK